jgi:hypothetical protein
MSSGIVYIAHAVDTEGPLYEGLAATFERIYEHYRIRLSPSSANLQKLRDKELDLGGLEDKVRALVDPEMTDRHLGSWDQIDEMHSTVMSPGFREKFRDKAGQPYVISWHCMDHVGFENNPRQRAMGFHAIFTHYTDLLNSYQLSRDRIYLHFHPPSFSRDAHRQSCGVNINLLHNEVLARRIIDHKWFPVANRPGGHYETFDINVWLESWIPFDIAHQNTGNPEDLAKIHPVPGRFVDWRGAPTDWRIYHPSLYDHRVEGNLRRWISRCLNLKTRYNNIDGSELEKAFSVARTGKPVLVGVTNHDHRNMVPEIEEFVGIVRDVSSRHSDVEYRWVNVVEGFRAALGLRHEPPAKLCIDLDSGVLRVRANKPVWGTQPFLAFRTREGRYYRDDFINDGENCWTYCFDVHSMNIEALSDIGVAANDMVGNTTVCTKNLQKDGGWECVELNQHDWIFD